MIDAVRCLGEEMDETMGMDAGVPKPTAGPGSELGHVRTVDHSRSYALALAGLLVLAGVSASMVRFNDVRLTVTGMILLGMVMAIDYARHPRPRVHRGPLRDAVFWLYSLGSLMALPGLFAMAHGALGAVAGGIVVYAMLGLAAFVLDRRVLLVAGLPFFLVVLNCETGIPIHAGLTTFAVGAILGLLVLRWHELRTRMVRRS
jgi:hypothetical protein